MFNSFYNRWITWRGLSDTKLEIWSFPVRWWVVPNFYGRNFRNFYFCFFNLISRNAMPCLSFQGIGHLIRKLSDAKSSIFIQKKSVTFSKDKSETNWVEPWNRWLGSEKNLAPEQLMFKQSLRETHNSLQFIPWTSLERF